MNYEVCDFAESKSNLMAYISDVEAVHTSTTLSQEDKIKSYLNISAKYSTPPIVFE